MSAPTLAWMRWSQWTVRGHGDLGQAGGHELEQRHLGGGVLHGDPVGIEVGVAAAPLELLALGVAEVVDQDLLGEGQRAARALTAEGDALGQAGVDLRRRARSGCWRTTAMIGVDPLASATGCRQVYDKCGRSATERSPTSCGAASRAASSPRAACCPARASCRQLTRSAGSRSARRWSCCGTRGWSTPARASAGSSPPIRCARRSGRLGTIEGQLGELGVASERRVVGFGFVDARRPGCARCSASTRCSRCAGSTWPTASPSPASPCGAPRSWAPACRAPTSRRAPFYELLDVRSAAPRRRSARPPPAPEDAELLAVPVGSPVLRCERVTRGVDGRPVLRVRARVPRPPHRVRRRPAPGRALDRPSGLRLVE